MGLPHGPRCIIDMRSWITLVLPTRIELLVFVTSSTHFPPLSRPALLSLPLSLSLSLSVRARHTTAKMRLSYAAIAALTTSVAYSQSIAGLVAQLPSCALVCLATAATGAQCGLSDYACQCGPARGAITQSATPCITSSCTPADAASTSIPLAPDDF